jgi:carbon-monoxide dehydrogenase medium subunit
MSDTQYLAAKTINEAVEAHNQANGSARFLAGGTDLLVQIKSGIKKPNLVIDVKKNCRIK